MKRPALPDIQDDEQASVPASEATFERRTRRRRKKRRQRKKKLIRIRHISPTLLFVSTLALSFIVIFAFPTPWLATVMCLLIGAVLYVDEQYSFSWSSTVRRSYKIRNNFSMFEVIVLVVLFCMLALLAFQGWVFELSWRDIDWNVFSLRWPF